MRTGTLKFFYRRTGFGFLEDTESGEQFFVGYRSLPKQLRHKRVEENTPVTFEAGPDTRTDQDISAGRLRTAINVQPAEG